MRNAAVLDQPEPGRPFIKWAGGKRQLLPHLLARSPSQFGRFYEPFVGGGALFFSLRPQRATLADVNSRLIRTYKGVRDDVEAVISRLHELPHDAEFFYEYRQADIDASSDTEVAAWFIYLNKTGFNGLYRVNRADRFNVPFGRNAKPTICDEATLRNCSTALAGTQLLVADFEVAVAKAKRGDFVYFDPPYVPLSASSSFTSYTSGGFGADQQRRLRDVALRLKRRGVRVLLSNSSAPLVRELYGERFKLNKVLATRMVNSNAAKRGAIVELLME